MLVVIGNIDEVLFGKHGRIYFEINRQGTCLALLVIYPNAMGVLFHWTNGYCASIKRNSNYLKAICCSV
jgi:hypothetical protein